MSAVVTVGIVLIVFLVLVDAIGVDWIPRSPSPRFPTSESEARKVYRHWDRLNGRYYFVADVALRNGNVLRDVVFDGESNIAVALNDRLYLEHGYEAALLGVDVADVLMTTDCASGSLKRLAVDEAARVAFASKYHRS
jgi:hypothetical protein